MCDWSLEKEEITENLVDYVKYMIGSLELSLRRYVEFG